MSIQLTAPEDVGHNIDFSVHSDCKHAPSHLRLAVSKNFKLGARRPCATFFSLMFTPLMICMALTNWFIPGDRSGAYNFAAEEMRNATGEAHAASCVTGFSNPGKAHSLGWRPCTDTTPQNCTTAFACAHSACLICADSLKEWASALDAPEANFTAPPSLDTLFALKLSEAYLQKERDDKPDATQLALVATPAEVAAGRCDPTALLVEQMEAASVLLPEVVGTASRWGASAENCPPYVWGDEGEAVNHAVRGAGVGTVFAVVVLRGFDGVTGRLSYTLRLNSSEFIDGNAVKYSIGEQERSAKTFISSGFFTLQAFLDRTFITNLTGGAPEALQQPPYSVLPMPVFEQTINQFWTGQGPYLPLNFFAGFGLLFGSYVGAFVAEKEQGMRAQLLIMGIARASYYLSWVATYSVYMFVVTLLVTLITSVTFLEDVSPVLTFLLLMSFALSLLPLGLIVSLFFSKARTARGISNLFLWVFALLRYALPNNASSGTLVAASLNSPLAFMLSVEYLIVENGKRGNTVGFGDFFTGIEGYSYGAAILMMLADTAIYFAIFLYLDEVVPSEDTATRHPLFFLNPFGFNFGGLDCGDHGDPPLLPRHVDTEYTDAQRQEFASSEAVRINGLHKAFSSSMVAVNRLGSGVPSGAPGGADALTFHEGQVQCILGHNGAGKTTLINLLTGKTDVTDGDATAWGKSIRKDMMQVRQWLGLCPQANVLWDDLTCEEHLLFFGRLKAVPEEALAKRIAEILSALGLTDKRASRSKTLSGGMKRKLCVACALVGGARMLILDEPTAGMDVESRRSMWSLLRNPTLLAGRALILTTHYMEEADVLGDSVLIMHDGCLHSWGSSLYLKSRLGVGYNMSVSMGPGANPEEISSFIQASLPRAVVERLSCSGSELRLRIPTDSAPDGVARASAARLLEAGGCPVSGDPSQLREALEKLDISEGTPDAALRQQVLEGMRTVAGFPALFEGLQAKKEGLQIEGYGVGMTTLEEVFLKIAIVEQEAAEQGEGTAAAAAHDFGKMYTMTSKEEPPVSGWALWSSQFTAMFRKRALGGLRGGRVLALQVALPFLMVCFSAVIGGAGVTDPSAVDLTTELTTESGGAVAFSDAPPGAAALAGYASVFTPYLFAGYTLLNATAQDIAVRDYISMSGFLADTAGGASPERHAAISFDAAAGSVAVMPNLTEAQSLPASLNAFDSALLRRARGDAPAIDAVNHPLPLTEQEKASDNAVRSMLRGIVILVPLFIATNNIVTAAGKERESKAKHVQLLSGTHIVVYWAAHFAFDFLTLVVTIAVAFVGFFIVDLDAFIGSGSAAVATLLLLLLYVAVAIVTCYIFSLLFQSCNTAQDVATGFSFLTGFLLAMISFVLGLIPATHDANQILKFFLRVFPPFCLGDGVLQLSTRSFLNAFDSSLPVPGPFEADVTGYDMLYLTIQLPVLAMALALMESAALRKQIRRAIRRKDKPDHSLPTDALLAPSPADLEDTGLLPRDEGSVAVQRRGHWLQCDDPATGAFFFNETTGESKRGAKDTPFYCDPAVLQHAREVNAAEGGRPGDYVTVQNLWKAYPPRGGAPRKVAVRGVSFGVGAGELFAFLGTNGAGKTTTLSVLSGEESPTQGSAFIAGHDVSLDAQKAHQNLGFCPQFNALLDDLTAEEHLRMFASIRGVPPRHVAPSVELLLNCLALETHRAKLAKNLSGGNKRKLSVAMALMGGPSALFLDEPSAGMDPMARRALWDALERAINHLGQSVIITTHHLEEIEGLSRLRHRITIMVDGRLQCLGSLSHLKQSLGDAYEVTLKVASHADEAPARRFLCERYPGTEVVSSSQLRMTLQVPKSAAELPDLFRSVEEMRLVVGVADYAINEKSLELVFVRLSHSAVHSDDPQDDSEDAEGRFHKPTPPSAAVQYGQMDYSSANSQASSGRPAL